MNIVQAFVGFFQRDRTPHLGCVLAEVLKAHEVTKSLIAGPAITDAAQKTGGAALGKTAFDKSSDCDDPGCKDDCSKCKARLGSDACFKQLSAALAKRKGVDNPDALSAFIGAQKSGAARMREMAPH